MVNTKKTKEHSILERIAFGITLGTVYGTVAYLKGLWPFTEITENEFQPTRWINETRGPILQGPGTVWYVFPIIKKIKDREGNIVRIPKRAQQRDIKNLTYFASDGTGGTYDLQYRWLVPTKKDAEKFYWEIEDRSGYNEIEG